MSDRRGAGNDSADIHSADAPGAGSGSSAIEDALRTWFGFEQFRPGQREVIEHLVAGRSAAAVFPTGGGKSLCYQLPALLLPGVTLVVSPLIALMKDQIDVLVARGIDAARLDSSLSLDESREVMERLRSGQLRLLYVAPERFHNERFREQVERLRIGLFAVDEAHCISEWGHNFRPDYLKLARFARQCGAERVLALTATATPQVMDDICRQFEIEPRCGIRTPFYRANLELRATPVVAGQRDEVLASRLRDRSPGPTIVYVTQQKTAEQVAAQLAGQGWPARAYHAGMPDDLRHETQDWFLASDQAIVVATIAFGMGIDKANIRYVYHYNLAKSLENYAQEIGRAGRDGVPAVCETLLCPADLRTLENFVHGDTPTAAAMESFVTGMFQRGEQFDVSLYELSQEHDIRDLVLRTLLTYLELEGYLDGGTPFYADYRFKPLASSADILARFDEARREFLAALFRQARKAQTWFEVNLERAAATGSDRQRVVRALDYLAELGLLELKVSGLRHRYRRLRMPDDPADLAQRMYRQTVQRQQRELDRVRQVLDLLSGDQCLVSRLGEHFGEPLDLPCGHCSRCLDTAPPAPLPALAQPVIEDRLWQQALTLRRERASVLEPPVAFTRFLCGVSSPALVRGKLTRHELFGCLADVPFEQVLARS
ncbi:MAG: RecQ family ATP-dependent DNA helicase [Pirellulaceae bacterium]|nr:RecQ family ATP-dependent DNA helicase [Pirellulaceae bacterium]